MSVEGVAIGDTLPAADGREESDFIAGPQSGAPSGALLIAGSNQGRAILLELRITNGGLGEKRLNICVIREINRFLRSAGDFFQAAKKENLDADRLRNGRHVTIVTLVQRGDQWRELFCQFTGNGVAGSATGLYLLDPIRETKPK